MTALFELLKQDAHVWDLYTARKEYGSDFTSHDAPVMTHGTQGALPEPAVSAYLIEHGATFDYGENRTFAVCLTHDVDEVYPPRSHSWATEAYYGLTGQARNLERRCRGSVKARSSARTAILRRSWIWRRNTAPSRRSISSPR